MIHNFIKKCNFDKNSIIFKIGTNILNVEGLCPDAQIYHGDTCDVLNNHKTDSINLICLNIENYIGLIFIGGSKILNQTEYIYMTYANNTNFNKPDIVKKLIEAISSIFEGWEIVFDDTSGILLENRIYRSKLIDSSGFWNIKNLNEHAFDDILAYNILYYFKNNHINTCLDLGCGDGEYVKYFNNNNILAKGYDGNPFTPELTNNVCEILDLSKPFDLEVKYDCVLSLEVGEHIPEEYESIFIDNIVRHAKNIIILSWAIPDQGGYGHINCKNNDYIKEELKKRGYLNNLYIENTLRLNVKCKWFENTVMVFYKNKELI